MYDKIIRYLIQALIIFLLFRYLLQKDRRLNVTQALTATIVILMLSIVIERFIRSYLDKPDDVLTSKTGDLLEKFDAKVNCTSCGDMTQTEDDNGNDDNETVHSELNDDGGDDKLITKRFYVADGTFYGDDDSKTNKLPMASDCEHSYGFLSADSN